MIWFALGAAVSALAAMLARLLIVPADELHSYLAVSERPYVEGEIERIEEIASTSGQLLRECGAKEFFIKPSNGLDGVPFALIKIVPENDLAIHCVFEKARDEGHPLYVQMLTEQQAQVY
ncbi:hypothetical protein GCM10023115_24500 [Pontixanthobacter gangjinensis]|uniref:Uncharacterized protein n=1 Tax=Pontixanthobacter gangjinensis TaxID=1028742 RepID=A0A6I4SRW9_9SPHN|nr:hypothetical protein [Pontixanthobacter gangjinensis]MXO57687.1 hypothetical protein [Pontixanthobacter gangjinensis]